MKSWAEALSVSALLSVILFGAGFFLLANLPSYNPYYFREDLNGPLSSNSWETVGSGSLSTGNDGSTLQSSAGQTFALRRYLWTEPKWQGAFSEASVLGTVAVKFRLNAYAQGALAYVILETDSFKLGLSESSIVFEDKTTGKIDAIGNSTVGAWHSVEIRDTVSGIDVVLDGSVIWSSRQPARLTWVALGNLQSTAFDNTVGGSVTFAEVACLCYPAVR